MYRKNITLAVLSWGSPKTLKNTLDSYAHSGLLNFVDEKIIYFQEITSDDIDTAKKYGFDHEGNSRNVGIADGYANLLRRAQGRFFLFCENDWEVTTFPEETR